MLHIVCHNWPINMHDPEHLVDHFFQRARRRDMRDLLINNPAINFALTEEEHELRAMQVEAYMIGDFSLAAEYYKQLELSLEQRNLI